MKGFMFSNMLDKRDRQQRHAFSNYKKISLYSTLVSLVFLSGQNVFANEVEDVSKMSLSATALSEGYSGLFSHYLNQDDIDAYNEAKAKYDRELSIYNQKQDKYQEDLRQFEKDKKTYENAITKYQNDLSDYEENKVSFETKKQEYEAKLVEYRKLKSEWDVTKGIFDEDKKEYDEAMAVYDKALSDYKQKIKDRIDTIVRNKQLDEEENNRRKEAYEAALRQQEIDAKKPGRFSSDFENALAFTHEPNANVNIDIGTGGAVALVKAVDGNWRFDWNSFSQILSSDKLDDATLKKNKLDTRVFKQWDPTITTDDATSPSDVVPTYTVLAKKNTPFKVTYTNIQNSKYDGRKITKIEYIYEVLETGSDSDLMQLNIAKDPTISVWLRGANGSTTHGTRVKLTPIFYDDEGHKIVPTEEKPMFLGMGSMNAHYATLDNRSSWFIDGKDLFLELMGLRYDKYEYVHNKFYEKYGVKWDDRYKNGFYNTVKSEWEGDLERKHFNEWDELVKSFNGKKNQYMISKYGNDHSKYPSQYREIVYNLTNGKFIKLNDSRVDKHPDGYYSDTSVDLVSGGWDDPKSKIQYVGAGVIQITGDNFSMEFGSTTPKQQRFALNTIVADMYIAEKPKLELQKTPEPPLPSEPTRPNVDEPVDPGEAPPVPPKFNEEPPEKPTYRGPEKPEPPAVPEITPPTPPTSVTPFEVAVPLDPPIHEKPEYKGGAVPLDPPVHEKPEYKGGAVPLDPPVHEKPEYKGGAVPLDPPVHEKPEYKGGAVPLDPPIHEKPEYKGGAVPLDPPVHEKPEYKIPYVKPIPPVLPPKVYPKSVLPKTAGDNNMAINALGALTLTSVLGLAATKRKKED